MQMALFLECKIKRQICMNGRDLIFERYKVDKYEQVSNEIDKTVEARGIFHTTNSYIKSNDAEGARLVSKPQPMILMLYEDGSRVEKDDKVKIGNNVYKVVEKNDVNNLNIAYDISLELCL